MNVLIANARRTFSEAHPTPKVGAVVQAVVQQLCARVPDKAEFRARVCEACA